MMRIALINSNTAERGALRAAIHRCAQSAALACIDIAVFDRLSAFHAALVTGRLHHLNVVFCCLDELRGAAVTPAPGRDEVTVEPIDYLTRLHEHCARLHLVIASHRAAAALGAYQACASFLHLPGTYDDLARVLAAPFAHRGYDEGTCLAVRSSGRVDNIAIADIQFVESSKRGPVIHLPEGRQVVTRGTLKALQEQLADLSLAAEPSDCSVTQPPFVMAGSSFVVNLDNVVATGQGVLVFCDGETIIVPVRKRKYLEESLHAYQRPCVGSDLTWLCDEGRGGQQTV